MKKKNIFLIYLKEITTTMSRNILVTGCGGDIGQSIGKILIKSELIDNLYGCDISNKNAGKFIFKNFNISVPCSDKKYLKYIEKFIKEKKIDYVIPTSEPELRYFLKSNILKNIGSAKLVVVNKKALSIGFDKLKTANYLEEINLPYPNTYLLKNYKLKGLPIIMKSRTGSGSSSVLLIENKIDYKFYSSKNPEYIVQEYLSNENGEYTCGLFRDKHGEIRSIIFKRELSGGYSGFGEVIENSHINGLLTKLAINLNLRGSINVQLRITEKGPVVFEINPRFSSTVLFRHLLGFKDLEWSLEDVMDINLSKYLANNVGKNFYKGYNEFIN